ncbi:unnamed protein product, partial [Allacma fusca]
TVLDPRCKLDWYKTVGVSDAVIKGNKKSLALLWTKCYKQSSSVAMESENETRGFDLVADQMRHVNTDKYDELRAYLSFPVVDSTKVKDVLVWWKENETNFPELSRMARDYLAVSGTGVPIERAFSFGTDLLKPKTMSMTAETIRKRFCLKAWLKYKNADFKASKMRSIGKYMAGCNNVDDKSA